MTDILTPAALAEIRERDRQTNDIHFNDEADPRTDAEHDRSALLAEVSRLNTELKALRPGPTTPAVCRALARFWTKMAENMEANALPAGRGEDGNG